MNFSDLFRSKGVALRIGLVTQCYLPTNNGVVSSIETFRGGLEKMGHEVFVFAPTYPGWPKVSRSRRNGRVFHLASIHNPVSIDYPLVWPYYPVGNHFKQIIEKLNLDILHGQHEFGLPSLARQIARELLIPFVCTYHTDLEQYTHYVPIFGRSSTHSVLAKAARFLNHCDSVITPSGPMAKKLHQYGVKGQINIVKTGITVKNYRRPWPNIHQAFKIPADQKILLYSGRLAKEKNLEFLIKAFIGIKKNYPACHLILAGGGPEENYFHKLVDQLKITDSVSFTGFLERKQVDQIYASADIFLFASLTDTQGIVLTEAMAGGTPVVAIDKMGPSEIVKSGIVGFLSKNNQADFQAKVLKLLRNDSLRQKMGQVAQKYAQNYSVEATTNELLKVYQETIQTFDQKHASQTGYHKIISQLDQ